MENAKGKSVISLKVKARGKATKQLKKKRKVTVKVKVRFTPAGGTAATKSKKVKLRK